MNKGFYLIAFTFTIIFILINLIGRHIIVNNDILIYLLGSAPNFIAAFFLPILSIFEFAKYFSKKKVIIFFYLFDLIIFLILIVEEYYPIFGNSKVFDIKDILFSFIGCVLALVLFHFVIKKRISYAR